MKYRPTGWHTEKAAMCDVTNPEMPRDRPGPEAWAVMGHEPSGDYEAFAREVADRDAAEMEQRHEDELRYAT
jgi:hypothetical protein